MPEAAQKAPARYPYLDLLKCIAVFSVCAYHFSWVGEIGFAPVLPFSVWLKRALFSLNTVCVPLFFMVNGALLFSRPLDLRRHFRKSAVLLGQYFAWRLITVAALCLIKRLPREELGFSRLINAVFFFDNLKGIRYTHLWFIPVLLQLYLLFPFLKLCFDRLDKLDNRLMLGVLLGVLGAVCFAADDIASVCGVAGRFHRLHPRNLNQLNPFQGMLGIMLCYFLVGGLLHRNLGRCKPIPSWQPMAGLAAGMVLLTAKWWAESLAHEKPWDSVFGGYGSLPGALMAVSVFLLAAKLPEDFPARHRNAARFIRLLGENTLGIYYLHWLVGEWLLPMAWKIFPHTGLLPNTAKAAMLLAVSLPLCLLGKKIPLVRRLF
ncbi:MAG: acyltransferase [Oscillospiraceae bacterium]|jgi:surface polysaccharide O-acyltransferase-like enzyme|nr:acyltransferase [Oscillospiraceae bacterium]